MIHLVILIKYLVPKAWEFSLQNFIMQRVQLSGGVTMSAFCREFKQVLLCYLNKYMRLQKE